MINWEIFVSVFLALVAAKVVGHITVGITYGHVQDSLRELDNAIGGHVNGVCSFIEQNSQNVTYELGEKLGSLDGALNDIGGSLNSINDKVYDIHAMKKYPGIKLP